MNIIAPEGIPPGILKTTRVGLCVSALVRGEDNIADHINKYSTLIEIPNLPSLWESPGLVPLYTIHLPSIAFYFILLLESYMLIKFTIEKLNFSPKNSAKYFYSQNHQCNYLYR